MAKKLDGSESDSSTIYVPNDWASVLNTASFQNSVTTASGNHGSNSQGHGGPNAAPLTYDTVGPQGGLQFNLIWESSVANAPTVNGVNLFQQDVKLAAAYLTSQFHDNVIVNITVGYGTADGQRVPGNYLGESITNLVDHVGAANQPLDFTTLNTALKNDEAKDGKDIAFPGSDPTNGGHFWVTTAEAKALGLAYTPDPNEVIQATNGGAPIPLNVDGHVGFNSAKNEFDFTTTGTGPDDGVTPGRYDLYGTVLHEITEVMGRMVFAGTYVNGAVNSYEPLDLFRFSAPNTPDTASTYGGYFSVDNGAHNLRSFSSSGDLGDWAVSQGADAFNTNGTVGVAATDHGVLPDFDLKTLDAIGWDHVG